MGFTKYQLFLGRSSKWFQNKHFKKTRLLAVVVLAIAAIGSLFFIALGGIQKNASLKMLKMEGKKIPIHIYSHDRVLCSQSKCMSKIIYTCHFRHWQFWRAPETVAPSQNGCSTPPQLPVVTLIGVLILITLTRQPPLSSPSSTKLYV